MTAKTLVCISVLLLTGCQKQEPRPKTWYYDQDIHERVFLACLEKAPAGPDVTKYNDWDEVVSECDDAAQSIAAIGDDSLYSYRREQKVEKQ